VVIALNCGVDAGEGSVLVGNFAVCPTGFSAIARNFAVVKTIFAVLYAKSAVATRLSDVVKTKGSDLVTKKVFLTRTAR